MEQIYTIPVNEAFEASRDEPACGCPMCAIYRKLEENELDLILGASMMEPDVRIKTNEQGFCRLHYDLMFVRKNRLGMALTLESLDGETALLRTGEAEKYGVPLSRAQPFSFSAQALCAVSMPNPAGRPATRACWAAQYRWESAASSPVRC